MISWIRWFLFNLPAVIFAWLAGRKLVPYKKNQTITSKELPLPFPGVEYETEFKRMKFEHEYADDLRKTYVEDRLKILLSRETSPEEQEEIDLLLNEAGKQAMVIGE